MGGMVGRGADRAGARGLEVLRSGAARDMPGGAACEALGPR